MLMQNTVDGSIRDIDPGLIPAHKTALWQPYTPPQAEPMPLATYKAQLVADIDLQAERSRLKYITAGSGQALEYRETAEEAARYVATQGAGSYPMLQASVDAGEAATLADAAALVAQREAAWATIGASIRQKRIAAKRAIAAAQTAEAATAAAQVEWP